MQRSLGAAGRVRIVRHHHDGFTVVAVESLQQIENLFAGFAVEIAGGFVAEQQRGIGHNGAGDSDSLLLAAGKLARIMLHAIGEPHHFQRDRNALSPFGFLESVRQKQWQFDILFRRQLGKQIVELENETDVPGPPAGKLTAAQATDALEPSTSTSPSLGVSSPPIRFRESSFPNRKVPLRQGSRPSEYRG